MHELHKYLNHKPGTTFFQTICPHVKITALAFKISSQTTDTENKETTNQILRCLHKQVRKTSLFIECTFTPRTDTTY